MKLEKSIVILKRCEPGTQVVDLVLLVKHPEGCNPVERLYAGVQDFLQSETNDSAPTSGKQYTWSDLMRRMQGWDWSSQEIYIEEAPMWTVLDQDESSPLIASRIS
jgi:hypothetical protein